MNVDEDKYLNDQCYIVEYSIFDWKAAAYKQQLCCIRARLMPSVSLRDTITHGLILPHVQIYIII